MNITDIEQVIKDNFTAHYVTNGQSIETHKYKSKVIREYAVNLWHLRIDPEIERDRQAGITVFDYMKWCREQWQRLRPLKPDEPARPDPDREAFMKVREFVKVMAAVKFYECPDQFRGPGVNHALVEWAKNFWLLRPGDQQKRDMKLGIIQYDYELWVFEEFERQQRAKAKTC